MTGGISEYKYKGGIPIGTLTILFLYALELRADAVADEQTLPTQAHPDSIPETTYAMTLEEAVA